ncbi:hypothetical protein ILUMI_26103, partial [Ignelater luminosus]
YNAKLLGPGNGKKQELKVYGKVKLPIKWSGDRYVINCFVVDTSENLLGNLRNFEYEIELKENAVPYAITTPRRIPLTLTKEVEKELNRMERDGGVIILSKNGLTLNKDECEFRRSETPYLGFIISANGIRPDAKSVETIKQYPVPTDVTTLIEGIASTRVLAKFSTSKKTRVSSDSSSYGIGAVLEQQQEDGLWQPVYFCSKMACERLEQFLLGTKFEILTDDKPLTSILQTKELNRLSNRLQRFRIRLSKFNEIQYVPGKNFYIPDALSRAPLESGMEDQDILMDDVDIYMSTQLYSISDCDTKNDDVHEGHMGINKCLLRAKETVWWPGLRQQLINLIEFCETCLKNKQPSVEPTIPSKLPTRPWEIIGADLACHNNNTYLVIQYYYSKYPEIRKLQNTTSQAIVEYCKELKMLCPIMGYPPS